MNGHAITHEKPQQRFTTASRLPVGLPRRGSDPAHHRRSGPARMLLCLLGLWALTGCQGDRKAPSAGGSAADPWQPIFDGQTLGGWHTRGEPGVWRVEEGAIVGELTRPSPYAYLVTDASFEGFELTLKMRYETRSGNSGVFFWSIFPPQCPQCDHVSRDLPEEATRLTCPTHGEVEALPLPQRVHIHGPQVEFAPPNMNTGGLYDARFARWINEEQFTPQMQEAHRFGEWNDLRILARGREVTVELNGLRVSEVKDYDFPARGHIALQLHSGEPMRVRFKDLRVRRLPD